MSNVVIISIRWNNGDYSVSLLGDRTVAELKEQLCALTNVMPARQKILGLMASGKPATDQTLVSNLSLAPGKRFMMMGSPEASIVADPSTVQTAEVVDDFDITDGEAVLDPKDNEDNLRKIANRIQTYKAKEINPPRPGKKLLVLDIDYTLFDHRSTAEKPLELMRPFLHDFLTAAYEHYDIIIWSATSLKWIELKMKELGVSSNPNYKLTAMFDDRGMITVTSSKYGLFNCKPLQVVWDKYADFYGPKNTIMFDDLGRNFIMNPQNGLKIKPFKNATTVGHLDDELKHLTRYLLAIAQLEDFSSLKHSKWRKYLGDPE